MTIRTPRCLKIRYRVADAPEVPVEVYNAPDITLAPTFVEIRYLAPLGVQPAFVDATVTGYWMRGGERVQPEKEMLHHFKNGPDGWPEWLAAEARLHDPQADDAARREQIRRALAEADGFNYEHLEPHDYQRHADAILALPGMQPPAERAAGGAEQPRVTVDGDGFLVHLPEVTYLDTQVWAVDVGLTVEALRQLRDAADAQLRRLADEAQQQRSTPAASPRCICGDRIERWTGPGDPGWIHSPGSDTPCTDARLAHDEGEHCFCGPECADAAGEGR
ncbi:hypothetical protein [Streptomyces sp. NPDC059994]|uniref:hypothetical protein n=1 Tax=Streptomyces sp. NPDC059994 TaxID=3347029 RepID=UPI0036C857FF